MLTTFSMRTEITVSPNMQTWKLNIFEKDCFIRSNGDPNFSTKYGDYTKVHTEVQCNSLHFIATCLVLSITTKNRLLPNDRVRIFMYMTFMGLDFCGLA
jgi:hypothetical protein